MELHGDNSNVCAERWVGAGRVMLAGTLNVTGLSVSDVHELARCRSYNETGCQKGIR